jgi:transposase-like protein
MRMTSTNGLNRSALLTRQVATACAEDTKCSPAGHLFSDELAEIEALVAHADTLLSVCAVGLCCRSVLSVCAVGLSGVRVHAREIPSMTELPPLNTRRWVARRKAAVVAAVSSGMITIDEACRRYQMSDEEFSAWRRAFENYGILGLRAGCIQQQRGPRPSRPADPSPGQVTPARKDDVPAKI